MFLAEVLPEEALRVKSMRLKQAVNDKNLARIGDAVFNFVFSLAVSKVGSTGKTVRVHDKHLAEAAKMVGIAKLVRGKRGAGEIGDIAEALIAYHMLVAGSIVHSDDHHLNEPRAKSMEFKGALQVEDMVSRVVQTLTEFGNPNPGTLEIVEAIVPLLRDALRDLKTIDNMTQDNETRLESSGSSDSSV